MPYRRSTLSIRGEASGSALDTRAKGVFLEGPLQRGAMRELVQDTAKALVDNPDEVVVTEVEGEQTTVLELRVAPSDVGKVIGKQGRTARAIRTLLGASGMKLRKRFILQILE